MGVGMAAGAIFFQNPSDAHDFHQFFSVLLVTKPVDKWYFRFSGVGKMICSCCTQPLKVFLEIFGVGNYPIVPLGCGLGNHTFEFS